MAEILGIVGFGFSFFLMMAHQLGLASQAIEIIKKDHPDLVKGLTPVNTYLILNAAFELWSDLQTAPAPIPRLDFVVRFGFLFVLLAAAAGAGLGALIDFLISL